MSGGVRQGGRQGRGIAHVAGHGKALGKDGPKRGDTPERPRPGLDKWGSQTPLSNPDEKKKCVILLQK